MHKPDAEQEDKFLQYIDLLVKWNRVHNLTAIADPAQMRPLHIDDSLSIAPWIHTGPVADIGSGAGLPGIPLAIVCPNVHFVLIESNNKKARFLRAATTRLQLDNVDVLCDRVEDVSGRQFAAITSRAFSSLSILVNASKHLLDRDGKWLAMKGRYPEAELAALSTEFEYTVEKLEVQGVDAERHLVIIGR